jgi:hypothetical protein
MLDFKSFLLVGWIVQHQVWRFQLRGYDDKATWSSAPERKQRLNPHENSDGSVVHISNPLAGRYEVLHALVACRNTTMLIQAKRRQETSVLRHHPYGYDAIHVNAFVFKVQRDS